MRHQSTMLTESRIHWQNTHNGENKKRLGQQRSESKRMKDLVYAELMQTETLNSLGTKKIARW